MTWNASIPNGSLSVRANKEPMVLNNQYIETTMGNTVSDIPYAASQKDHFWAPADSNLVGHHRWIKMPAFTVGGTPSDPGNPLGTGLDGIFYFKSDGRSTARVTGFFRNNNYIYQVFPILKTGSKTINDASSYITLDSVPDGVYGEIFLYNASFDTSEHSGQKAIFKSRNGTVQTWSLGLVNDGSSSVVTNLKFGNGSNASGLNIRVRLTNLDSIGIWNYILTYRNIP